jgi:hypothetical protein
VIFASVLGQAVRKHWKFSIPPQPQRVRDKLRIADKRMVGAIMIWIQNRRATFT